MTKLTIKLGLAACVLVIVACSSTETKNGSVAASGKVGSSWAARMQGMAGNLEDLMPYVFSRQEFMDEKNKSKIKKMVAEFEKSIELVPRHIGEEMLGKDPLVKFTIARLQSNTAHAARAFDEGHAEFSRNILKENMGLCFSCHTTNQMGPQSQFTTAQINSSFRIYPTERADYYVATRQYDKALSVLEGVLKTPGNWMDDPHEQVAALRKFLALEVRVKNEPARAAQVIESFLNNQKLPYFIAVDAEAWLKSLRDWQKEKSKDATLAKAQTLLRKAKGSQSTQGYQSAYVDYLRASAILHDSLRRVQDGKLKAEVYQMLGESYETLAEMGTWDLPEVYFEACVRSAPKTNLAQRCYKDFERTIILGFSGSAGIFIPKEERERMSELKSLAGLGEKSTEL